MDKLTTLPARALDDAFTDLVVFAVGHEIAAIQLCGQAAVQCTDPVGRMLLVDLALARFESLEDLPLESHELPAGVPRVEKEEVRHLIDLRKRRPAPRASLRRLRLADDLIRAVQHFDEQALAMLSHFQRLIRDRRARDVVESLSRAKRRWIELGAEIRVHLAGVARRAERRDEVRDPARSPA